MSEGDGARDWFPVPRDVADVSLVGPGPRTKQEVFALLTSSAAVPLRDKAGVAGGSDGSARWATRLLEIDGTIAKRSLATEHASLEDARRVATLLRTRGAGVTLWHPDKQWLVLGTADGWHVASTCPRLVILRALETPEQRLEAFGRAIAHSVRLGRAGIGVDLGPSNFGLDASRPDEIFYVDDELYEPLGGRDVGEAMAARVPEEASVAPEAWSAWGETTARRLLGDGADRRFVAGVVEGIEGYPIVDAMRASARALAAGVRRALVERRARPRRATLGARVCVLADVHANLVALDAVLAAALRAGADSYLFLGDAVGYGPWPAECVGRLAALDPCVAIRGNHDDAVGTPPPERGMNRDARAALAFARARLLPWHQRWLATLPLEAAGPAWLAVHGAPRDPARLHAYVYEMTFRENLTALQEAEVRLCFHGHTHVPFVYARDEHGAPQRLGGSGDVALGRPGWTFLLNPGSVGQPRDGDPRASFAIWHREEDRIELLRASYDVDSVVRAIEAAGLPTDLGDRLWIGR